MSPPSVEKGGVGLGAKRASVLGGSRFTKELGAIWVVSCELAASMDASMLKISAAGTCGFKADEPS